MSANFLALILARGGSKGIPKKNIKILNGKPLLAYTIEEAKKSKFIDRVVLSTESEEIAEVGKRYGAEVPFMRPKELATDEASSIDAIIHALNWLKMNEDYWPKFTVLLQPTSPLRTVKDIDGAIEKLLEHNAESLVSLCEVDKHPFWLKKIIDNRVVPYTEEGQHITRRQDLPKVYSLNGAIFIAESILLVKERSFYVGRTIPYIMPKERSVDIDNIIDWHLAEILMKERD
ncbi:acylneuraminate cytidylyltransferase [Anoxybacter fermentans]|uniref:Acylneuraminate cytidylyltransferase n=1 Tax=Anoxybacter fermentans TaxID=1323375 RepID=A0A3S9T036_9FIRM|nr:acylneuraminate cytidylyltransferase family protein [Anoxybacter fermentans]AZR73887.1 acylneuraminate cytidylyltransferase [Anoxybacter fermentans]